MVIKAKNLLLLFGGCDIINGRFLSGGEHL